VTTSGSNVTVVGKVNGVTYPASPAVDTTPIVTAAGTVTYKAIPDCDDTVGQHLNYDTTTHAFSCGTSGGSALACTPAGASGQSQYNNAGVSGGSSGLTMSSSQVLTVNERVTTMSADLTISTADGPVIACTAGATTKTATLPTAVTSSQGIIRLVKVDTGAGGCSLVRSGTDTINNAATALTVLNRDEYIEARLVSSTNWVGTVKKLAVSLTADVTGVLPVANGGTGAATLTGLVLGNGTSAMTAYGGAPCTNQFIRSLSATGAATCASVSLTADVTGRLPYANLVAPTAASKLLGRGDTTGDWQEITLGTNLSMSGATLNATGGGGAPTGATYWTSTADATLSSETNLGLLSTGLVKITVATGTATPSTAVAGTDYQAPLVNSAGLAAALSDETGTGLAVFATNPVLTTPNLGTPSSIVLTNGTLLPLSTGVTGRLPYANLTAPGTASKLLGRGDTTGDWQEITLGSGLAMTGTTLASTGGVSFASAAETTTGTDAAKAVTPDGLAGSDYGKRYITIMCVDDATVLTTGTGKCYFPLHPDFNGWNFVGGSAHVGAVVGATSTINVDVQRCGAVATGVRCSGTNVSVFSTVLTIDPNEDGTETAATAAVVNAANQALATGQWLRVDVAGTFTGSPQGLYVTMVLQKP
jgi:hypothetical protein